MADMALKQPIMVSRLPKFGSRTPAATGPALNNSAIPVPSAGGKGVPLLKQNGVVRVPPSLSAKWKKGREDEEEKVLDHGGQQPLRSTVSMKEIRKPSASSLTKTRRLVPTTTTTTTTAGAGTRNIPQSTRANPRSSASKQASMGRAGVNGLGSSSSIQGSLEGGLSQSSDSLKSDLAENVVRSQSFSYVKTPASSTGPHLTRSFSFNRAAELAKELPRPLAHSPLARSPITQPSLAISREKGGSFGNAKTTVTTSASCPLPSTALKKSLLPSCPGNKPSALSYRLTQPSLIKQPLPVLAGKVQLKSDSTKIKLPTSETSSNTESAGNSPDDEPSSAKEADGMQEGLEVQEDMSLSSTSSLERNDGSEEYMDDFDDLGNGGVQMLPCFAAGEYRPPGLCEDISGLLSQDGSSVSSLHSFLSENVDWAEMALTGGREGLDVPPRRTSHSLSTGPDLPHGSSLDLSPSDSSGGTYMWDEEVLEPLGGGAHGCGSFDSDLNSMDILNNLENLASCDLEEDDLMLDAELPEDVSLHSDGERMSRYDLSEGGYWSSQWRRRQQQQRWGRKEQILPEHRVERHAHGLEMAGSAPTPEEELMLNHMLLDCSSVKEQLLQLRRLLQAEDDAAVDSAVDFLSSPSSEESSCQQQVQELLVEVQELREQLKQKERLITTLTQLTSAPPEVTQCHCKQEDQVRPGQQEKGTQTPWRTLNPQVSQSSRPSPGAHHSLAMSPSSAPSVPPSDRVDPQPGDRPVSSLSGSLGDSAFSNAFRPPAAAALTAAPAPASARPCATPLDSGSDELSLLLTAQLRISDLNSPTGPRALPQRLSVQSGLPHAPLGTNAALPSLRDGPPLGTRRGPQSGVGLIPSVPARLPPPSRGLPCITSASRAPGRDLTSRLPKPKTH